MMRRVYWKYVHAFQCIFMALFGIFGVWITAQAVYDKEILVIVFCSLVAFAGLSHPIYYLMHRHKKPWMAYPMFLVKYFAVYAFLSSLFFIFGYALWTTDSKPNADLNGQVVGILLITAGLWMYYQLPKLYRKRFRPYHSGISAKANLTNVEEMDIGRALIPLHYRFTYQYFDDNVQEHESKHWTTAVPRLDALKVGDEIEILYDPEHPENSVWPMG